jgi:hypothetical protein
MKWSGARNIYVPKIGLSDGIVKAMYYGKIWNIIIIEVKKRLL